MCISCTKTQTTLSENEKAVNPPIMGWSSWNAFRVDISEDIIKHQADLMVEKGLKDVGYHYVNVDDGYFGKRDDNGIMLANEKRFPNGMKPVADQLVAVVEKIYSQYNISIDEFAQMMGMGRTVFYKKLRGVTGYSPNEYLRVVRMKKAAELFLTERNLTVAEVSYKVGINDPLYFSKCFKAQFGVSPSAYQRGERSKT